MLQTFDERNKDLQIYVDGEIVHRDQAKVSVFDSVVQGGDAVWEGLRLYNGGILCLDKHLDRLVDSAHAMSFVDIPSREELIEALQLTLRANKMYDGVHIRLTLTRGRKITSGMDPRLNQFGSCLIIVPEYKAPVYDNEGGISIITSTIRRNSPNHVDSKIHHNNLINNILAKIQANVANVDAALMLDDYGFASELNGTNIFMIKDDKVFTPHADACLPGITRAFIIDICKELHIPIIEKNISLVELYTSEQVFCTGTMGELTPIYTIDGRKIGDQKPGRLFHKLRKAFEDRIPLNIHALNLKE